MHAEAACVFRHALLRDAACQLQLPAERAKGHATAFAAITDLCGGLQPEGGPLDPTVPPAGLPHEADAFAAELAVHAGRGLASPEICRRTTRRAAEVAEARHRAEDACALWQEHAALADPAGRPDEARRVIESALPLLRADRTEVARLPGDLAPDEFVEKVKAAAGGAR